MKYITSSSTNDGVSTITATFDVTRDPDLASVDIQNRVNTALGRLPNAGQKYRRHVAKTSQNFVFGAGVFSRPRRVLHALHQQLPRCLRPRRAQTRSRRRRRLSSSASANIPCASGSIPRAWPLAPSPPTMLSTPCRNKTSKSPPARSVSSPRRPGQQFQISVRAVGRLSEPREFDNIILKTQRDGTLVRLQGRRSRRTRRRRLQLESRLSTATKPSASASRSSPPPTPSTWTACALPNSTRSPSAFRRA